LTSVEIGILFFLGLAIGSWIAIIILTFSRISPVGLPLFSGGFLAGLIGFTFLPHAFHHTDWGVFLIGFIGSILILSLFHQLTHHRSSNYSLSFIAMAVTFHTIPLCLAIGAVHDPVAAGALTLAIILHHIPEAAALTLWAVGRQESLEKLFLYFLLLSGVAMASVQLGSELTIPAHLQSGLIGLSVGILLYTLTTEFIMRKPQKMSWIRAGLLTSGGLATYGGLFWLLKVLGLHQ